jgi:hypothetical protein
MRPLAGGTLHQVSFVCIFLTRGFFFTKGRGGCSNMDSQIVDPNFLAVVQSLKPYMNNTFLQCTEAAENMVEVLASEKVKQVYGQLLNLRQDYQLVAQSAGGVAGAAAGAQDDKKIWDPYVLFLILILLLLSTGNFYNSIFAS